VQPSPPELEQKIELRIRTIRTLWFALLVSVLMYFVLTLFIGKPKNATPNNLLSVVLAGAGVFTTLLSLVIKSKFLARSVEQQRVDMVQQGYLIAWVLCETAALLGLLDFFVTGNRLYWVSFVVAAIGQLVNFPRRQDVLAASFKTPTF